jgi:putative transposase
VFLDDEDRQVYSRLLSTYAERHGIDVWAYCLMANHVHLIVVPRDETALGKALHDAHSVYGMRMSDRTGERGHVWQGRFFSCPLDAEHTWAAMRYVERNPVRAGIVEHAADYSWSSARAHCCGALDPLLSGDFPPAGYIEDWRRWLREEDEESCDTIRVNTRNGWACGSAAFIRKLEAAIGRPAQRGRRGRRASGKRVRP